MEKHVPIFPWIEQLHILCPGIVRAGQLSAKKPCAEEQPRQGTCSFPISGWHKRQSVHHTDYTSFSFVKRVPQGCYLLRTVTTWWHRWRACYTFKLDRHLHSQISECWIEIELNRPVTLNPKKTARRTTARRGLLPSTANWVTVAVRSAQERKTWRDETLSSWTI